MTGVSVIAGVDVTSGALVVFGSVVSPNVEDFTQKH